MWSGFLIFVLFLNNWVLVLGAIFMQFFGNLHISDKIENWHQYGQVSKWRPNRAIFLKSEPCFTLFGVIAWYIPLNTVEHVLGGGKIKLIFPQYRFWHGNDYYFTVLTCVWADKNKVHFTGKLRNMCVVRHSFLLLQFSQQLVLVLGAISHAVFQ